VKEVQAFLGLLNYYRKFIGNFSNLATPLNNLTKKDKAFVFNYDYRKAFKELKHRLIVAPILIIYDLEKELILETDASDFVISRILT
jgi:hypothetical protein